jgi:hypothetical protein
MKALKTKKILGCLEGSNVYDILLDSKVNKDFINYLAELGRLLYDDVFEKPFYKVIVRGKFTLKGSQGNRSIRVLLPEKGEKYLEEITGYIDNYNEELTMPPESHLP